MEIEMAETEKEKDDITDSKNNQAKKPRYIFSPDAKFFVSFNFICKLCCLPSVFLTLFFIAYGFDETYTIAW